MTVGTEPSPHRAVVYAAFAATGAFLFVPVALAFIATLGGPEGAVALAFGGFLALALGPWILLAAYIGGLVVLLGARLRGVSLIGRSLRACLAAGATTAAVATLAATQLTAEVDLRWLWLALPAGVVAGAVFFRHSRAAAS